jgi:hypothetical protein
MEPKYTGMYVEPTRLPSAMAPTTPWQPNSGNSMMPMNTQSAKVTNLGSEANKMVTPS